MTLAAISTFSTFAFADTEAAIRSVDLNGHSRVLASASTRATVLIFILHDCPVCNRYAPEIDRIDSEYRKQGVETYVVYEESDLTPAQARHHAAAYRLTCGLLYDPKHELAHSVGAIAAPEAVVIGSHSRVVYRGRIDDSFRRFGMAAPAPTSHDLRAAVDDLIAGRGVAVSETPVIGCAIARD